MCGNYEDSMTHLFFQKLRESNILTKEITKELISQFFFFGDRNFLLFPHCAAWKFQDFPAIQILREINPVHLKPKRKQPF